MVGPSGSGKSSLLRAGLIPAIRNGALDIQGAKHRPIALFTPGTHPMGERARHQELASASDQLPAAVVVDQFEEVFTLCQDEEERRAFITALCAAGRGTGSGGGGDPGRESEAAVKPTALIVLGLRADFYPHALRYPELVAELQRRQILVGPMTEEELRSADHRPGQEGGSRYRRGSGRSTAARPDPGGPPGAAGRGPRAWHAPAPIACPARHLGAQPGRAANRRGLPRERRHPWCRRRQRGGGLRRPHPRSAGPYAPDLHPPRPRRRRHSRYQATGVEKRAATRRQRQ